MLTDAAEGPLVIGHRGSNGRYPENTLLAFQRAIDAGADALELDVRISADQTPVVIHDETLDRTTDDTGPVGRLSAAELRRLNAGQREPIPRLSDVLESFPSVPLLIDVKEQRASRPVIDVLTGMGARDRVLVGSFNHAALVPFRQVGIRTAASRCEVGLFWTVSRIGVRPPGIKYHAISVPEWWRRLHLVDERFLRVANRVGTPVHVWTVDDPARAKRLWGMGVAGVITNCPEELCRVLGRSV